MTLRMENKMTCKLTGPKQWSRVHAGSVTLDPHSRYQFIDLV